MSTRRDLITELLRRDLAADRASAEALIASGRVTVDGAPAMKGTRQVHSGQAINVTRPPARFVSRAGFKLEAALETFPVTVDGRRCLDVGASTGGFTDCLLQRGASAVVAVDVGHGHLHERLRADARVTVVERVNVRTLTPEEYGHFPLVTIDVSFTSLLSVLPACLGVAAPGADLVVLVKPQFEASKEVVSKGQGVISDPSVWRQVLVRVLSAINDLEAATMGLVTSPVLGAQGNVEFLLWLRSDAPADAPEPAIDLEATLTAATELVSGGGA